MPASPASQPAQLAGLLCSTVGVPHPPATSWSKIVRCDADSCERNAQSFFSVILA